MQQIGIINKILRIYNNIPSRWQELIRFCIVGGIATIVHYAIYLLLKLWIVTWLAYTIGYALSFIMNYLLTNAFTFRTKPTIKNGGGFIISHGINYGLQIILLELFITLGISSSLAPIPVYCIVIPVNFLLVRFVFKKK
jgi:putative flippase GtrA